MSQQPDTQPPTFQRSRPGITPGMYQTYSARTAGTSAAFLLPHLRPGMQLLDCGCGLGSITVGLAEAVAPGRVVGLDLDAEAIKAAGKKARELGIANVSFEVGSLYELPFDDNSFDVAYEHMVLMHVPEPLKAVEEVYRVLRPNGVFGARDRDKENDVIGNPNAVSALFWDLFLKWQAHRPSDLGIGPRLPAVLEQAGFADIEYSTSLTTGESFENRLGQLDAFFTNPEINGTIIGQGWADQETLDRLPEAIKEWGRHPEARLDLANANVIGWKK
ncbi:MAG: methyltransferase domain-containing protein [Dehalococcoidia bacterium]